VCSGRLGFGWLVQTGTNHLRQLLRWIGFLQEQGVVVFRVALHDIGAVAARINDFQTRFAALSCAASSRPDTPSGMTMSVRRRSTWPRSPRTPSSFHACAGFHNPVIVALQNHPGQSRSTGSSSTSRMTSWRPAMVAGSAGFDSADSTCFSEAGRKI